MNSSTHFRSVAYMLLLAVYVGVLGGLTRQPILGIIGGSLLAIIYGIFFQLLGARRGMRTGLLMGSLLGGLLGGINLLLPMVDKSLVTWLMWGFIKGAILGSVLGVMTRPPFDEEDSTQTRLFLVLGALFLGVLFGGGLGLLAGGMVWLFMRPAIGVLFALAVGGVVGGYLGSYFGTARSRLLGAIAGTAVSLLAGVGLNQTLPIQATSGLLLGGVGGAMAPMLWFSLIGFYGGTRRGIKAAFFEGAQAPVEMIRQGFVPFFGPAFLIGAIVGTAVFSPASLILLILLFSIVGVLLGVIGELTDHPNHAVTIRHIVEMIITGAENWPSRQAINYILQQGRLVVWLGVGTGLLCGVLSSLFGAFIGQAVRHQLF